MRVHARQLLIMMSMARPIPNLLQVPVLWAFAAYNKLCDMLRGAMDTLRALSLGRSQAPEKVSEARERADAKPSIAVGARTRFDVYFFFSCASYLLRRCPFPMLLTTCLLTDRQHLSITLH